MIRRLIVALIAIGIAVVGSWALQLWRFSSHVAVPNAAASPTAVVKAFVAAVNAHDCATAGTLWPAIQGRTGGGWSWCQGVESMTATYYPESTHPEAPGSAAGTYNVGTEIRVHTRLFHQHRGPAGPAPWNWALSQTSTGWRIVDAGEL